MKFFENNLKDRFKNASSLDGVDVDDIWNNIAPAISEKPAKKRPFFFRKWNLFLLLFLLIFLGSLSWFQLSEKTDLISPIKNFDAKVLTQETPNQESNQLAQDQSIVHSNNFSTNKPTNSAQSLSENLNHPKSPTQNNNSNLGKSTSAIINKNIDLKIEGNKSNLDNTIFESNKNSLTTVTLNDNKKDNLEETLTNDITPSKQIIDIVEIPSLPFSLFPREKIMITPLNFDDKKQRWSLGFFMSIHTIKNRFSPTSTIDIDQIRSDLLNSNYQLELGYAAAMEVNFKIQKNVFLTSGLEYIKSRSEFNLVQSWDSTMINPNSPVGAFTDAKATRTIRHHNSTNFFSVPVMLGIQKSINNMEIGTSVGIGMNFTSSQNGKSLNFNDQIAIYPNTENDLLPVSNFFLSYHLRPHINYKFDRKTSLQFRADLRYQHFKKSEFFNLNYSALFWGFGVGIQYNL